METKREMRQRAIKRLNEMYKDGPYTTEDIVVALAGSSGWVGRILDLLTDDESSERYMRVPVDADDIPIHIGDRVVEHEDGHDFIVDGYEYDGEWWVFHRDGIRAPAHDCTHYNVMDVLSELVEKVYENAWNDGEAGVHYDMYAYEKLMKEYAEKLRLKED
jgi:hypothetical protein